MQHAGSWFGNRHVFTAHEKETYFLENADKNVGFYGMIIFKQRAQASA